MLTKNPYAGINFVTKQAKITNKKGEDILNKQVEFPDYFTDNSVTIVTNKYLCNSAKTQETKLQQMIDRVSDTITNWGIEQGYFKTTEEKENFNYALKYYQIHQYCAFNSPIYFNIGLYEKPQLSACFILDIDDNMESITEILKTESLIFKNGSGSGMNLSRLRGSNEKVRGGGKASGPVSFAKAQDINAGVIKSGGTLRRSAKLLCLNVNHPDIENFITCKNIEEEKLKILSAAGIQPYPGYDMTDHVFFQNTNLSVGITQEFINALLKDEFFSLVNRTNYTDFKKIKAKDLLYQIAQQAWLDGCPGLLFLNTMNDWNTCSHSCHFESTNPCGEYVGANNTSCNLASINLLRFFEKKEDFSFDIEAYKDVIKTMIKAQDIIIDKASYPTKEIEQNTIKYRALGLGFSNLGSTLMFLGIPYDSDQGRYITSSLTSFMTSTAYKESSNIAEKLQSSFYYWEINKDTMRNVFILHNNAHNKLMEKNIDKSEWLIKLQEKAKENWNDLKYVNNIRNSQVTLIAPTGTISFLMGCDTFGCEPEFSLKKYKILSGSDGAIINLENNTITSALFNLGYNEMECIAILSRLHNLEKTCLKKEHLPIFDTAMKNGSRQLSPVAHIKMMSAIQPFISGAISKTINLPEQSTVEDVYNIFLTAYKKGLKGITIYRDNSKNSQPLNINNKEDTEIIEEGEYFAPGDTVSKIEKRIKDNEEILNLKSLVKELEDKLLKCETKPTRKRLPETRKGKNHHFYIGNISGYLTLGEYDDGSLGEIYIRISKQGSTLSGLLDIIAIITSMALQYGVPLFDLVRKLKDIKFDPSGLTKHQDIKFAKSIIDYIFKFLAYEYLENRLNNLGLKKSTKEKLIYPNSKLLENKTENETGLSLQMDISNPICEECGAIMYKIGSCYNCIECGNSSGTCG